MPQVSDESKIIRKWAEDILAYVRDVFGVSPTPQQRDLLLTVEKMTWAKIKVNSYLTKGASTIAADVPEELRLLARKFGISVMAGVGTGKGACAVWIVMWFLSCFPRPKIVCVGPSAKQLRDNLWAELSKWSSACKLGDWFTWQSDKFFLTEKQGREWFASARTANARNSPEEQAETLAGIHEDFVLIVADEASGIPDPVFRPLESTLTRKCNFALLFFNPTRAKGFAFDTHYREAREEWVQFHWNAEESPLVTRDSIERLERKYGRDSNSFRIRVLGLPPVSGERTVIPWDWIVDASERDDIEPLDADALLYSLDVGAGGDDSVLLKRHGPRVYPLEVANYDESNRLVDWAVRAALSGEPKAFYVDSIGWGWGIAGELRRRLPSIDIVSVNVAEKAFDDKRFFRLRDQLWWRTREEFEKGIVSIPKDPLLMGDLNAPLYDDSKGVIKVESKKELKDRGVDSPNRADALIQTTLNSVEQVRAQYNPKKKKEPGRVSNWRTA